MKIFDSKALYYIRMLERWEEKAYKVIVMPDTVLNLMKWDCSYFSMQWDVLSCCPILEMGMSQDMPIGTLK